MILGAAGLIAVIGDGEQGVQSVGAHAALHAAAHAVADQAGHELLLQQVLLGVMDMGGTVNGVAGDMTGGGADVGVSGVIGSLVALAHDVGAAHDPVGQIALSALLAVGTVQLLSVEIDVGLHRQQAGLVRLIGANTIFCHFYFLQYSLTLPHINEKNF